jgi:hypothetical protein
LLVSVPEAARLLGVGTTFARVSIPLAWQRRAKS